MIVFEDLMSGDELFTDVYKMKIVGEHGLFYEVKGKIVKETDDVSNINTGSNPSAEEEQEGLDESVRTGCNIVLSNRLVEMDAMSKQAYMEELKNYTKKLKKKLEEEADKDPSKKEEYENFAANMTSDVKSLILKDFKKKQYQFFKGESLSGDGMIGLMYYPPEDETGMCPVMYFIKSGLLEKKC